MKHIFRIQLSERRDPCFFFDRATILFVVFRENPIQILYYRYLIYSLSVVINSPEN